MSLIKFLIAELLFLLLVKIISILQSTICKLGEIVQRISAMLASKGIR